MIEIKNLSKQFHTAEGTVEALKNVSLSIPDGDIFGIIGMSGIIGGGGLGKIAINYGYYRYKYLIMIAAVVLLIILVQIFQSVGTRLAVKADKRIKVKSN